MTEFIVDQAKSSQLVLLSQAANGMIDGWAFESGRVCIKLVGSREKLGLANYLASVVSRLGLVLN